MRRVLGMLTVLVGFQRRIVGLRRGSRSRTVLRAPIQMRTDSRQNRDLAEIGAGDEIRTHDPNLGKVVLYP